MTIIRFGVSLEQEVLTALDNFKKDNRIRNRSQAINHLISNNLVEKKWQCNNIVAGSITLVFDHHKKDIINKLSEIKYKYQAVILSSLHFHLDNHKCMEIVATKGRAVILTELADTLIALKGIHHGKLTMSRAD